MSSRLTDRLEPGSSSWRFLQLSSVSSNASFPGNIDCSSFSAAAIWIAGNYVRENGGLSVHKSAQAEATVRARGAWLSFLPQYSPDLNPIEMAFAKLKAHLHRIAAGRSAAQIDI
jgi:hypothetical protein